MLILQQFKVDGYLISFKKVDKDNCIMAITEDVNGSEQRIVLTAKGMRKLFEVIANMSFMFSDNNNEK